jgi:hypothetical protein
MFFFFFSYYTSFFTLLRYAADEMQQQTANGESAEMLPSERVMQMEEDEKREQEEKKRHRDPPIVFKDLMNVQMEYEGLVNVLEGKLNDEEQTCMNELRQYILENEGSWALGDNFLNFVGELNNIVISLNYLKFSL